MPSRLPHHVEPKFVREPPVQGAVMQDGLAHRSLIGALRRPVDLRSAKANVLLVKRSEGSVLGALAEDLRPWLQVEVVAREDVVSSMRKSLPSLAIVEVQDAKEPSLLTVVAALRGAFGLGVPLLGA